MILKERHRRILLVCRLLLWLYLFMVSIEMMGGAFKTIGADLIRRVLEGATANPIVGVCIGLLATAIVQSSSFTTSTAVALVAGGMVDLPHAVPIVMGANIGTTITNNFVATAHIARREEFRLAFSGGTIHDIFNMLSVACLLPIEILFHPLERAATALTGPVAALFGAGGGEMARSPVKVIVAPAAHLLKQLLEHVLPYSSMALGVGMLVAALLLLFFALSRMVVALRQVFLGGIEKFVNEYLFKRWWTALLFGLIATAIVQSSSMTVSLLVPMVGSGILTLESAFPFTMGANIGTTVTAFLAALVTGSPTAISLALAHFFFNVFGAGIFLPLRKVPIYLARRLSDVVYKRRWFAFVYIAIVFFIIPIILIALSKVLAGSE